MGAKTGIEWTDATWNPLRGCSRVSDGCRNCYAEQVAARFSGPGQPYEDLATRSPARWTGQIRLVVEHLTDPLRWERPRRIFVNSMSDLFHKAVPDEWINRVFAVMALAPQHTFQVLTKRPERMREYLSRAGTPANVEAEGFEIVARMPAAWSHRRAVSVHDALSVWPLPSVWLGVSVEDSGTADERIPLLLQTPAAVRFVSYEPALGPVFFGYRGAGALFVDGAGDAMGPQVHMPHQVDWIIVGGESGPSARPFDVAWARATIKDCATAGVACFVKQLGAKPFNVRPPAVVDQSPESIVRHGEYDPDDDYLPLRDRKGGDWSEWPEDLRVRKFPAGAKR